MITTDYQKYLINEAFLEKTEQYAYYLFSPKDIAIILEVEENDFYNLLRFNEDVKKAFYTGYYRRQLEINKVILDTEDNSLTSDEKEIMVNKLKHFKTQIDIIL